MPSGKGDPLIWEIWEINQVWSRHETNPKQPNDPKEQKRPYLIIADPMFRRTATCCPLNEKHSGYTAGLTEVELPNNYGKFIKKDCLILCHEIYTLEMKYFTKSLGKLLDPEITKVGDALYEFLKV